MMRDEYNTAVKKYNTDAKTYSDLAKKYLDAVTARKAQLADPMKASFETALAVPKVPCLSTSKPAAYSGRTPLDAATTLADFTAFIASAAEAN